MFSARPLPKNFLLLSLAVLVAVLNNNLSEFSSSFAAEDLVLKENAEALQFSVNEGSWVSVSLLPDGESFFSLIC